MPIRNYLKKKRIFHNYYRLLCNLKPFFTFSPILFFKQYLWFFNQHRLLKKMGPNKVFQEVEWYPCLFDKITHTPIDPVYFYQDSWAAGKVFEMKPRRHVDIGSSAKTMGILSQFVPVTMVDIRPIGLALESLNFVQASITELPFKDQSIESLSCLCVVEHIGLGRYGDKLDPYGSEKAIMELKRVLARGGYLLISLPVDKKNKIYFNAHRAFSYDYIRELFSGLDLVEEKFQYGPKMYPTYMPEKGFGTGMFMLRKKDVCYNAFLEKIRKKYIAKDISSYRKQ